MTDITRAQAQEIVKKFLAEDSTHDFVLLQDETKELPSGWAFFYTTRRYLETHNPDFLVPGTGPLIMQRDGKIVPLTTSVPPETAIRIYIEEWKKTHSQQ